ncbi:hypothetical protein Purlil1_1568 [Purpureocillium lilacinum]|uniref:Uncharacterized protein n=1 Tax=Purpureocillium lilacinum TaxID=33203 RepID=A0ABR0CD62_PURLI|nr:hypothetical protein Purlil1_1568 [Purpureocillium lilacinum]
MGKGNFATSPVVASPAAPGVWPWGKATGPRRVGCSTHSFVSMDAMAHCANGIRADAVSLPPLVQPAARPPRSPPASPPASQPAQATSHRGGGRFGHVPVPIRCIVFCPFVTIHFSPGTVAKGAEEEKLPLFSPPFRPPFFACLGRAGRAMLLEGVGRRRTALVAALGLRLGVSSGAIRVGRRGGGTRAAPSPAGGPSVLAAQAPASGATVASDDPSGAVGEALPADSVANLALDPERLAYPNISQPTHCRAGRKDCPHEHDAQAARRDFQWPILRRCQSPARKQGRLRAAKFLATQLAGVNRSEPGSLNELIAAPGAAQTGIRPWACSGLERGHRESAPSLANGSAIQARATVSDRPLSQPHLVPRCCDLEPLSNGADALAVALSPRETASQVPNLPNPPPGPEVWGGPWYQIMPVAAAASVGAGAGAGSGSGVAHDDAVTAAPTSSMRRALASETHTAPRPSPADLRRWVWHCCRSRMEPLRRLFLHREYHVISCMRPRDSSPIILACSSRFGRWPWIAERDMNLVISRQ